MTIQFRVRPINDSIDVFIDVNGRIVSVTSYRASDDIEAHIPALVEKAKSTYIRAIALENALNKAVQS